MGFKDTGTKQITLDGKKKKNREKGKALVNSANHHTPQAWCKKNAEPGVDNRKNQAPVEESSFSRRKRENMHRTKKRNHLGEAGNAYTNDS